MNAVVTLNIGNEYRDIASLTLPLIRSYAERIGAKFIVIEHPELNLRWNHLEKLQIYNLLSIFKRVAFVDIDVLFSPDAPSLFDVVPNTLFGACLVDQWTTMHDSSIIFVQNILGNINWCKTYFNSGVMVASQLHREVFNPSLGLAECIAADTCNGLDIYHDQTYLNYNVHRFEYDIFDIGFRFNHTTAPGNSHKRFNSHIIHYPGAGHRYGSKLQQIRKDRYIIEHHWLLELFRKYPLLTFATGQTRFTRPRRFR